VEVLEIQHVKINIAAV